MSKAGTRDRLRRASPVARHVDRSQARHSRELSATLRALTGSYRRRTRPTLASILSGVVDGERVQQVLAAANNDGR